MQTTPSATRLIETLRGAQPGTVLAPDDPGYDDARGLMPGGFDLRPAAIARPADAAGVAAVVDVAREHGIELAVRSGGHSAAGHGSVDGGLVIDLRDLQSLDVDIAGRTAWAGTGLTAAAYTKAVGAHGLATGFGDTGSVGIGGITLGGGVGYLVRKLGLTIDSLEAAEIVTADGRVRLVDADHEPDLFWAIRGGGGNFGVATRFRFRLHPVDRVVGGMLLLPATVDTIAGFVTAAERAPETLSAIANVMPAPPMPFLPPDQHGRLVIMAIVCNADEDVEAGQAAIAPFRALAQPVADLVRPIAYPEIYPPDDPSYHPMAVARTLFMDRVDRDVAGTILDFLGRNDAPVRVAQLRVLGGAMARVGADETAFAHRASRIMANVASFYTGPDDFDRRDRWVRDFAGALTQDNGGAYVNFLGDEGHARIRAAYPGATWDRLAAIKATYDPTNLFHRNQNIPPAAR